VAGGEQGIASRTLRGMAWAYGSYVGGRILVLLTIAILARLLTPSEFGLVAFATLVTGFLDTVSDLGVGQALIVVRDDDEAHEKANTAWTLTVSIGLGLTLLSFALAPVAASFFDEPKLNTLLPLLGLNFLIRGLSAIHFAFAERDINFRARTIAEMSDVMVRGATGIGLALAGAGAYSLVGGYLAGSIALTASLWLVVHFRPRPRIVRKDLRGLLTFGGGLTALQLISAVIDQGDYLVVGRVLGDTALGLYTIGFRLPEMFIINLAFVAGMVLFPAFAATDRRALASAYLTSVRYVLMVCAPLAVGLCVLAEPVVLTVFGDQWRDSIEVMQVLTLYAFAITLDIPPGTAYKSLSRIDILLKLGIPRALLALGAIVVFVDHGIVAVAACQAAVAALFAVINLFLASRMLDTGLRRILVSAAPPLIAGAAMGLVVWVISEIVAGPALTLVIAVPLGAVSYVATLWLIAPEAIRKLWRMAFPDRARGLPLAAEEELIDPGHHPSRTELFGAEPDVEVEWARDAGGTEDER
jgi:O-antigen/teichoic acid export membrane protein